MSLPERPPPSCCWRSPWRSPRTARTARQARRACEVTIGFRTDVEPFSYLVRTDDRPEFKGYLADLCYALFHGSAYTVRSLPVTVTDRFRRIDGGAAPQRVRRSTCSAIRPPCASPACDQEVRGFYSPIVFVSGVTDLVRKSSRHARTVAYLGFASNTTAKKVARKACEIDLLRIRDPGAEPAAGRMRSDDACGEGLLRVERTGAGARAARTGASLAAAAERSAALLFLPDGQPPRTDRMVLPEERRWRRSNSTSTWPISATARSSRASSRPIRSRPGMNARANISSRIRPTTPTSPTRWWSAPKRPELAQFVQRRVYEYFSQLGNPAGPVPDPFPRAADVPGARLSLPAERRDGSGHLRQGDGLRQRPDRSLDRPSAVRGGADKGCGRAPAVAATLPARARHRAARRSRNRCHWPFRWPQRDMEAPGEAAGWPLEAPGRAQYFRRNVELGGKDLSLVVRVEAASGRVISSCGVHGPASCRWRVRASTSDQTSTMRPQSRREDVDPGPGRPAAGGGERAERPRPGCRWRCSARPPCRPR